MKKLFIVIIMVVLLAPFAQAESRFFITPRVSYIVDEPYVKEPEVFDEDGNTIKDAVMDYKKATYYEPKLPKKYIGSNLCRGWVSSKYNDDYYIIQIFASLEAHASVAWTLNPEESAIGKTLEEAKETIDNDPSLSSKITSTDITTGNINED